MSDRISVRLLREEAALYHDSEFEPFSKEWVLALVDAVDAAHEYAHTNPWMEDIRDERLGALKDALDRFDFGKDTARL